MTVAEASGLAKRSEAQVLRSLVENGVAKRFNLRAWSEGGCKQETAAERLQVLFEQVRPDVAKLIVLEELEVRAAHPTCHLTATRMGPGSRKSKPFFRRLHFPNKCTTAAYPPLSQTVAAGSRPAPPRDI